MTIYHLYDFPTTVRKFRIFFYGFSCIIEVLLTVVMYLLSQFTTRVGKFYIFNFYHQTTVQFVLKNHIICICIKNNNGIKSKQWLMKT